MIEIEKLKKVSVKSNLMSASRCGGVFIMYSIWIVQSVNVVKMMVAKRMFANKTDENKTFASLRLFLWYAIEMYLPAIDCKAMVNTWAYKTNESAKPI